jgi:CBS domain-containing membrane protein
MEQKTPPSASDTPMQHDTSANPPNTTPGRRPYGRIDREHPIGGEMSDILRGLFMRARLPRLLQNYARIPVLALFSFVNGCISIGLMSVLAVITHSPFIFPSLGPTAFLFFYTPTAPSASPRNTLIGHAVGVIAGYFSLVVTGLTMAGPALAVGVTWPRVIAAALSLGLTAGLMVLLKSPHPPAGATTLIISLGLLRQPWQLVLLMVAVVLLTLQAIIINRLAGIPYPLWNPVREPAEGGDGSKDSGMRISPP